MRLSQVKQAELDTLIDTHGLWAAWVGILRAYVHASDKKFSYVLRTTELRSTCEVGTDLLQGLSIGEVSALYEYALAYADRDKRKIGGQYFTPDDVSQFLATQAKYFSHTAMWIDPCAGVGNLSYWLVKAKDDPEQFVLQRLYLVDRDPLALLTARVLFTIAFQREEKDFFSSMSSRCLVRDFLSAQDLPKADAAILNPPYVSGVTAPDHYRTAPTRNTYAFFIEKVAKLCQEGYISITPQNFTNGQRFATLRAVILAGHKALDVYCFDNVPDNIFSGFKFGSLNTNTANSTRAGVIVARSSSTVRHRITPLLRWRSHERAHMLASASQFLTKVSFSEMVFPKIGKELVSLYREVQAFEKKLGDLLSQRESNYPLQVPTTPRYFISANKRPVYRTSFRILYFHSANDRDMAYILLNSSYMYWWWRVNDGGMTISEKTLLDLPIPTDIDNGRVQELVDKLERSERSSKVIKMNAGKAIENIKHSQELVLSLTQLLFPDYAQYLSKTHFNSHLQIEQPNTLRLALNS